MGGFVDLWLKCAGRRPWRWWLIPWLVFIGVFLLTGVIGYHSDSWPDTPPSPTAIDYLAVQQQGGFSGDLQLDLRAADIPVFDPATVPVGMNGCYLLPHPETGETWLLWTQWTSDTEYGWPFPFVGVRRVTGWDVSDPARPFAPASVYGRDVRRFNIIGLSDLRFAAPMDGGAGFVRTTVFAVNVLCVVLSTQLGWGLVVGLSCLIARFRGRRRCRRGACLACGHLLGPEPRRGNCPECGTSTKRETLRARRYGIGARFLVLLAIVLAAMTTAQFISHDPWHVDDLEVQLERVDLVRELAIANNRSYYGRVRYSHGAQGWPLLAFVTSTTQYYIVTPTTAPTPGVPPPIGLGLWYDHDMSEINFAWEGSTSGLVSTIRFPWKFVVLMLGACEIAALLLAVPLSLAWRFLGRCRAGRRIR